MPSKIEESLYKFQHPSPLYKQNSHHHNRRPQYRDRIKYAPDKDTTSELDKDNKIPEDCWNTVVLCKGYRLYHTQSTNHHCITAIQTYRTHS